MKKVALFAGIVSLCIHINAQTTQQEPMATQKWVADAFNLQTPFGTVCNELMTTAQLYRKSLSFNTNLSAQEASKLKHYATSLVSYLQYVLKVAEPLLNMSSATVVTTDHSSLTPNFKSLNFPAWLYQQHASTLVNLHQYVINAATVKA